MKREFVFIVLLLSLGLITQSCVKVINPSDVMDAARKRVQNAKDEQADVYAPDHMDICSKEISRSEQALEDGNNSRARGWARRAMVDAELAALLAKYKRMKTETEKFKSNCE